MNSISLVRGNIFNSSMQTIVNTVNTVGFMGAGIALEYKRRFPEMYEEYNNLCTSGQLKIGKLYLWKKEIPWVLNFPTKIHYSNPSKLEFIEKGLNKFKETYREKGITSIAFPQLGTQLGGLSWENDVQPLMYDYLHNIDIEVEIYEFDPEADDDLYLNIRELMKEFTEKDFKKYLNIGKKTSENILENLDVGIRSMKDFEFVKGVGEEALKNIYKLAKLDLNNAESNKNQKFEQVELKFNDDLSEPD